MQFTGTSIARVFFITAGTFAAMSLYGYTTKRDLTKLGGFIYGFNWDYLASMLIFLFSLALWLCNFDNRFGICWFNSI